MEKREGRKEEGSDGREGGKEGERERERGGEGELTCTLSLQVKLVGNFQNY